VWLRDKLLRDKNEDIDASKDSEILLANGFYQPWGALPSAETYEVSGILEKQVPSGAL